MIKDEIDPSLNLGTFEMTGATHNYNYTINGRTIIWTFANIDLPDSGRTYHGSQGFLSYSLHRKEGLPLGTQILNNASIYFDYNLPVITNTVKNTMINNILVEEIESPDIIVYPNPNSGTIYFSAGKYQSSIADIVLRDITGKIIHLEKKFLQSIKVSKNGVYIITFQLNDKRSIHKKIMECFRSQTLFVTCSTFQNILQTNECKR